MKGLKPWAKMPTEWIADGKLHEFRWFKDGSTSTAALMVYYALCQFAHDRPLRPDEARAPARQCNPIPLQGAVPPPPPIQVTPNAQFLQVGLRPGDVDPEPVAVESDVMVVRLTYDNLVSLTGLSRDRISVGLAKLIELQMIWKLDGAGTYGISGFDPGKRWAMLPGSALTTPGGTSFTHFAHFKLRSKHEVNALKLHFYYAFARDSKKGYCEASFEKIFERTGVAERDIPPANSLLLSATVLVRIKPLASESDETRTHGPNHYYLNGYTGFFLGKKVA